MDDEKILFLFAQRQDAALAETAAKYGKLCFRVADNILCNEQDSEECVNDTWLRAWNSIPPERPQKLSCYLARVTRNLAITRFRSRRAQKRGGGQLPLVLDELAECVSGGPDPQQNLESRELSERIDRFLSELDPGVRDVFVARYFFAASVSELSERTGRSKAAINSILQRTRKKLQTYLKEEVLC